MVGHLHRQHVLRDKQLLDRQGNEPIALKPDKRYLVVPGAACDGRGATLDTETWELVPFDPNEVAPPSEGEDEDQLA